LLPRIVQADDFALDCLDAKIRQPPIEVVFTGLRSEERLSPDVSFDESVGRYASIRETSHARSRIIGTAPNAIAIYWGGTPRPYT
jgi:hypothetical protein